MARELRPEELSKFSELVNTKEGSELYGSDWGDAVADKNQEFLIKEGKIVSKRTRMKIAKAWGFGPEEELIAKGIQKGRQEGILEILSLLEKKGVPVAGVKRELQLA